MCLAPCLRQGSDLDGNFIQYVTSGGLWSVCGKDLFMSIYIYIKCAKYDKTGGKILLAELRGWRGEGGPG